MLHSNFCNPRASSNKKFQDLGLNSHAFSKWRPESLIRLGWPLLFLLKGVMVGLRYARFCIQIECVITHRKREISYCYVQCLEISYCHIMPGQKQPFLGAKCDMWIFSMVYQYSYNFRQYWPTKGLPLHILSTSGYSYHIEGEVSFHVFFAVSCMPLPLQVHIVFYLGVQGNIIDELLKNWPERST